MKMQRAAQLPLTPWKAVVIACWLAALPYGIPAARADVVEYEVVFDATWSNATHPTAYPSGAHFSGLIGGTHHDGVSFWEVGQPASDGIERMAETGGKGLLDGEVTAAINSGDAFSLISGGGIGRSPGRARTTFEVSATHPLATVVSMIAPSPDWFVGTSGLSLRDGDRWLSEIVVALAPYDAGSDSGPEFQSANDDTRPAAPISLLTNIEPFQGTPTLGTFTFRLLTLPGDFDDSGGYNAEDIGLLCAEFGSASPRFDLTVDGVTDGDDLDFLVSSLIGTRPGDLNLDGKVEFEDFLGMAAQFGQPGDWAHGDLDCSGQVEFADFLRLSSNFGFAAAATGAASVPEPRGLALLTLSLVMLAIRRRNLDYRWAAIR